MKIKNKLFITLALIIFSTLFVFTNSVQAVGNVYQTWVNNKVNDDGEIVDRYLLYRTYTTPTEGTVRDYEEDCENPKLATKEPIDGQKYTTYNEDNSQGSKKQSMWLYRDELFDLSADDSVSITKTPGAFFSTIGLLFHSEQLGEYTTVAKTTDSKQGLEGATVAYNTTTGAITSDFESIAYARANSTARYVTVANRFQEDSPNFTNYRIGNEIMSLVGEIELAPERGTGLLLKKGNLGKDKNKKTQYRHAVVGLYDKSGKLDADIFVSDNIVDGNNLDLLIKGLKGSPSCYVSNIVVSMNQDGEYDVAKSAKNIFSKTYNKKCEDNGKMVTCYGVGYKWGENLKGLKPNTNAMGSILNLFDNILQFPAWTKRQVVVRHINIGNNTTISIGTKDAARITPENPTLLLDNPTATIKSEQIPEDIVGEEYYTNITIEQGVTKQALADTSTYKCIGYNVAVSSSYNAANSNLQRKYSTSSFSQFTDTNRSVHVDGKQSTANDDCIIIEFYYTERDKDVYVNHIYLDRNGIVRAADEQIIEANKKAVMNGIEIINLSTKKFVEEIYQKKLGNNITTKTAESLKDIAGVKYQGYELFDSVKDINEIIGKQIIIPADNTSSEVTISGDTRQVNYYYYIDNWQIESPPDKNIGGKVFANITGSNQIEGACTDTGTGFSIKSVPTQTNMKVGIQDIPKGMLSAVTTKYVGTNTNTNNINIKLNIVMGSNRNLVKYTDLKYSVGYYKITNMLVHKLKNTTIYDADSTEVKTAGSNLFDSWNNNKITLVPNNIDLDVELIGINGKVKNNEANINNIYNYVRVYLKDKYGNTSSYIDSNGNIVMDYINSTNIPQKEYMVVINETDIKKIAETLGLTLVVEAQNMTVKIGGEAVNSSDVKVEKSVALADYLDSEYTLQVATKAPNFQKDKYQGIGKVTENDYTNSNKIDTKILNGIRTITGKIEYEPVMVIGDEAQTKVTDNVYYSEKSTDTQTVVFEVENQSITKVYEINNEATNNTEKYKDVALLNVYTPITVTTTFKAENNIIVDQTENIDINTNAIQINTPFTITLDNAKRVDMYDIDATKQYNGGYYIKFDFDVHQVKINGVLHKEGKIIKANTWIGPIYRNKKDKASITAQAYGDLKNGNTVSEENNKYTVRAVTHNITDLMRNVSLEYSSIEDMMTYNETLREFMNNICDVSSYFSETEEEVAIVNRLYDFRVTDLKDINWKNVFRKSSNAATNIHTGNVYYAGTTKWNSKSEKINEVINRTASDIGRNPLRILPIGPYKNSDTTYIKAPKLGYRFSFDMKLTGTYSSNKKVNITTKFYYVSKDGKTFIQEYDGKNEGIYLFYKNSNGKYVRIDETNGGGYNLTFIPNDGYRYIEDTDKSKLATTTVSLGNLRKIILNHQMTTTSAGEGYVTYYGEYKLPNSTIAVMVDKNGKYDINKPLTDGYIGVIFDIKAYTGTILSNDKTQSVNLSYSKDTNGTNTSQWDYEGFLGYTKFGNKVADNLLSLKLEKGKWSINNETYNKIKGSIVLYDIDQRAATDYE